MNASMNEDKVKDDPAYSIMVLLLVWALMLALGALGRVITLAAEKGCS